MNASERDRERERVLWRHYQALEALATFRRAEASGDANERIACGCAGCATNTDRTDLVQDVGRARTTAYQG